MEDSADEWETDVNTADVSNVMGHLCQDYLQLSAADNRPNSTSSLPDRMDLIRVNKMSTRKFSQSLQILFLYLAAVTSHQLICPDIECLNNVCMGFGSQSGHRVVAPETQPAAW